MKKLIACGVLLLLCLGGNDDPATHVQAKGKQVSKVMAEKLKHSQRVLEGIAVADFKKIETSADQLIELTKTEEWLMNKTPRYETHTNDFRRAAETLIRKAKDKNIDGATLAFFDLTSSCVRCHQYLRETRDARLPGSIDLDKVFALERKVQP
ncbi:MAG: hypothetical protein HY289_07980 [Planctomycetes bacterium]|nr:hypothetical protein [Planctomycetota bacterium]